MIDKTNAAEPRVVATQAALDFIREIQADHPDILFHQSGGCCDGSSPMCYPDGEFIVGDRDVLLGILEGAPVWISGSQFETWKHTQLVIDVVPGRGGGFSLETPHGLRFLSRGRAFTAAENELLATAAPLTGADYERGVRPPERAGLVVAQAADACTIPGRRAEVVEP